MWLAPERLFSARPRDSLALLSYWQLIWGRIGLFLFSLCWLTNLKQDFLERFSLWTQQLVCETQITEWLEKLIIPACRLEWSLVLHRSMRIAFWCCSVLQHAKYDLFLGLTLPIHDAQFLMHSSQNLEIQVQRFGEASLIYFPAFFLWETFLVYNMWWV